MLSEDSEHRFHIHDEPSVVDVLELCQCLTALRRVNNGKFLAGSEVSRDHALMFAHSSVHAWLRTLQHIPASENPVPGLSRGHEMIAETLLSYIMRWQDHHTLLKGSLLEYSIQSCLHHAQRGPSPRAKELATMLLDDQSEKFLQWRDRFRGSEDTPFPIDVKDFLENMPRTALHFAAMYSLHWAVEALLSNDSVKVAAKWPSTTALHVACLAVNSTVTGEDSLETIRLLLAAGANVSVVSEYCGSPLQCAVVSAARELVEALLDTDAAVHANCGKHGAALQAASFLGHLRVVELLITAGADLKAVRGAYDTRLQAASLLDSINVAKLLLSMGNIL